MKSRFVPVYLGFVAVVLSLTALAKLLGVLTAPMMACIENPLFGPLQPVSNEAILGTAALIELFIVGLVLFSARRWLPCLASTMWGLICLVAHAYFIISGVECDCLGWLAPGPATNIVASVLALALAAGGMIALNVTSRNAKWVVAPLANRSNETDSVIQRTGTETVTRIILIVGASACFVVGLKWMYWTIAYPIPGALPIALFAFIPIILMAPRSRILERPVFFISLGLVEAIVIACGLTL